MISIAMATYNGSKYIREQLDSILAQTLQDFELIICDDCSTDVTWNILQEYAKRDTRFHIYRNIENLGFKKNFEKAISCCTGEFIALSDQDDIWLPNHLELLMGNIGNKMISCGNAELMDAHGRLLNMTLDYQEGLDFVPEKDFLKAYSVIFFRSPYQGASMLIRREFLIKALPIPEIVAYHDAWFSELGCFYGGISFFRDVILLYRRHGHNVTGEKEVRRPKIRSFIRHIRHSHSLKDRVGIVDNILERLPDLSSDEKDFLINAKAMFLRKKSIWGRLYNSIYELRHYKYIFSCDKIHWI
ncbi:glycosyltransferase family 2 protein [Phocaeicola sp.]